MEFPFGVTSEELGSTGTVLKRILRRLTRVYDGRVAHNYVLLMYVANLVYRHASLAATSARVNMESSAAVVEIVNHPEWRERSEIVSNNPTGPEAKALIKQIAPLIRLAGKRVPWSPMERLSASYHIYALYHVFGAPAFFVTFSPKVLTNQLMLTFGEMQSPDKGVDLTLPKNLQHRVQLLTSNTIAQARAYELMLDAVLTVLFGIKPESKSHKTHMPRPGLFGIPTAYYGVTECQARNALHAHFVIWVRTMHPDMIQRIAHDDHLRQVLVNAVDAVVTASTEHFETCVSRSKVVCKFKSKPYGIRYQPTPTCKSVELKSVVWGSRASKFSLSSGMQVVSFAGVDVRDKDSDAVRDIIKGHVGPVTIVFQRHVVFDPGTGRVKPEQDQKQNSSSHSDLPREHKKTVSHEAQHCVSTGAVAATFNPPWAMSKPPLSAPHEQNITSSASVHNTSHESDDDRDNADPDSVMNVVTGRDEHDIELEHQPASKSAAGCNSVMNVANGCDENDNKLPESLSPDKSPAECGVSYPSQDILRDNILDQDFDVTRLAVGDVFFDGNNGDACGVDEYTLGWVEVVSTHAHAVFLSPIYSPQRPFISKGVQDMPVAARADVIDAEYIRSKLSRLPARVLELIRRRDCWEWDERLANKAAALSRLTVRGQIVMSAYNVHGWANGEEQRRHSHRCHKYKETYRAKWCALGFGRTVFDQTDVRHVIQEDGGSSDDDDVDVVRNEDSKQTAYDKMRVDHLVKPARPPDDGGRDDRVLVLDLGRKCGTHPTKLRKDVERAATDTLLNLLCSEVVLMSRVHHRVMSFLWNHEDKHHTYADQYMCETAPILAALLGCNTNVSVLGGNVQAINALFYLTGYLSKNPVKPTSWVTCIIAALKSTCRWQSVAKDVGTPSRNAKFFLQKVLNRLNALAEITDTQAAMLLLGFRSFQCSHRFAFCFHRQALETQIRCYNARNNAKSTRSTTRVPTNNDTRSRSDSSSMSDDAGDESGSDECTESSEESSLKRDKSKPRDPINDDTVVPAGSMIYRDQDDVAFALSQHHHHLHRVRDREAKLSNRGDGTHTCDLAWWYTHARENNDPEWRRYQRIKGLHDFTLMEYVRHIEVVEMPESLPTCGPVLYYLFSRDYPICDSHVQKLRGKHHVTVLSGRPPRHPGPDPERRAGESSRVYDTHTLQWQLKADVFGRTMGSIFSPWDAHGDCRIHSYREFEQLTTKWQCELGRLREDRGWRRFITRDRTLDHCDVVPPPSDRFPDPRPAARLLHAHNLGVNLRVPTLMKRIANKWRYQHCDRFDNPKEYDFLNNNDKGMSQQDKQNAIAIASLLETFSQSKKSAVTGIGVDTADHLNRMRLQVERLYLDPSSRRGCKFSTQQDRALDAVWYDKPLTGDIKWAKETLKEIMEREPDALETRDGADAGNVCGVSGDDELRAPMSPDQARVFDHATECFDANKPLRIFVHGGPGTGKTFLANSIMKAARARGMDSRFTALSGAAATINSGTTLHYAMGMTQMIKWGSDPTANQIKKIRHRNANMQVLITDEISMTHAQMWNQVQKHLEHARILKGLHIIVMGDMCQLPPPNQFVKPIYADAVLAARKPTSYSAKPLVLAGIKSFQTLRKMDLTTQNRAKDPKHLQTIKQLRCGVIDDEFINNLKPLTSEDVDNGWKFVPILVTSNAEAILLNKIQIVEFAKTHNQFVLKWTNPIRNCEDAESYDINIVEDIIPEAVQYFCMGAPGLVNANKNPVGTGIVNGYRVVQHSLIWKTNPWQPPEEGWTPGQIFEVPRPAYMVVVKDPDVDDPQKGSKNVGTAAQPQLIPLKTDYHTMKTQGVQISYNAFPFDLRFAITYHKVQGQTMNKVILFLHERRSRQLAPLQWESLYVAYTRVKYGDHIRVCYFGSDGSVDRAGLSHLKRLRRPKLYDAWQHAYDTHGKWDGTNLRKQAAKERTKLRRKLRRITSITQVSLEKLKLWASILDVSVPYKTGTKRKNKPQYVEAITPVWVGVNGGALTSVRTENLSRGLGRDRVQKTKLGDTTTGMCKSSTDAVRNSSIKASENRSKTATRSGATTTCNAQLRALAVTPLLTTHAQYASTQSTMRLRTLVGGFRTRDIAKRAMKRVAYCVRVPYVGKVSQWSMFALATPGEFICDTVLYFCASHFCREVDCRTYVVDPILPLGAETLVRKGIREGYLNRLHAKQQTLAFPVNVPRNVHWMVVLVWLNVAGKLVIQCRNSMRAYSNLEADCCRRVRVYMSTLYRHTSNTEYTLAGFGRSAPVAWTQQTPNVYACGIHVLSHIYLASKGLTQSHTFDNVFVEGMRVYCAHLLYVYTRARRSTLMTPVDLTLDDPRFSCMNE